MKNIYLGGSPFGSGNIGDDAIISSLINNFSTYDDEITICTLDNKTTYINDYISNKNKNTIVYTNRFYFTPKFGLLLTNYRNLIKAFLNHQLNIRMMRGNDLIICGGGTMFTDMPWHLIKILRMSLRLKIPAIIFGVGMAEIKDTLSIEPLKNTLNKLDDIYVRDSFVVDKLKNIGVKADKIKICFDPAITLLPNLELDINKYLQKDAIEAYHNDRINIGISLSSESDITNQTDFKGLNKIIAHLIDKYEANIFLIPTNIYNNYDFDFMNKLETNQHVFALKCRFEPEDLIEFLSKFHLVLSSRLHLNIMASITGTPFIGLVRNSKISDFSNLHELKSFYFNEIEKIYFIKYIDYLIENESLLRNLIIEKTKIMRETHLNCVEEIYKKYLS